tara:strand:- start:323 stop:538 length:216 start_codon:yes stop_codon:yes gene_type:complete
MTDPSGNGWVEYRKFVVETLDLNKKQLHGIESRLRKMEQDIVMLKTKMYVASACIGVAVSGIVSLLLGLAT